MSEVGFSQSCVIPKAQLFACCAGKQSTSARDTTCGGASELKTPAIHNSDPGTWNNPTNEEQAALSLTTRGSLMSTIRATLYRPFVSERKMLFPQSRASQSAGNLPGMMLDSDPPNCLVVISVPLGLGTSKINPQLDIGHWTHTIMSRLVSPGPGSWYPVMLGSDALWQSGMPHSGR